MHFCISVAFLWTVVFDCCAGIFCSISCMTHLKKCKCLSWKKNESLELAFLHLTTSRLTSLNTKMCSPRIASYTAHIHNSTRFLYGLWGKCLMYEIHKSGKEGLKTKVIRCVSVNEFSFIRIFVDWLTCFYLKATVSEKAWNDNVMCQITSESFQKPLQRHLTLWVSLHAVPFY